MRTYIEFASKKFQSKMAYQVEFFMGIVNTVISILVYLCIYKALYGGAESIDGITFSMVATNFVLSLGLSSAFEYNEMFLQDKIKDGSIATEFLRPVNFILRLLSENIGEGIFKVVFQFLPAVAITLLYTRLCPPKSVVNFLMMLFSICLGYMILWLISFIIQTWSFWLFSVWGILTIKNVFVRILSGTLLPLWFMPAGVRKLIAFTPFESIWFTPVQIYLGQLQNVEIVEKIAIQLGWIFILGIFAGAFWKKGTKKLVVQGG